MTALDFTVIAYTLGIYTAIVVSPGPNFALISRLALQGRKHAATGGIAGLAVAATFYAILAMVGLATLLNEIAWLARAMQLFGGCYLIYLGLMAWRSARQFEITPAKDIGNEVFPKYEFVRGFRLGSLVNLSNPKGITFFVSLYAVAVPADASISTRLAILTGGAMLEFAWYGLVVSALSGDKPKALYERYSIWIERLVGTILIFFGVRLALERQ